MGNGVKKFLLSFVFNRTYKWLLVASGFLLLFAAQDLAYAVKLSEPLPKQNFRPSSPSVPVERSACITQNLETLTTQLLRDLPAYANRSSQRARILSRVGDVFSYMLVAGKPDFTPLPLNANGYTQETSKADAEDVKQVFFTTLERIYTDGKAVELQQFHWLLLTQSQNGWRMVMMFSQTGSYPAVYPPTPPRDSTNGVVAQGVETWLRDCRSRGS